MITRRPTSTFISIATISVALWLSLQPVSAQPRHTATAQTEERDTTKFFQGFAVSADVVGLIQLAVSDYGQYEAALRVNLKDSYFPIFELGLGKANHDDEATKLHYKTSAPYFRIGLDLNLLKNKHDIYRVYGGLRYAFTSFKFDVSHPGLEDPVWHDKVSFGAEGVKSSFHWMEAVMGVDAKIWGPIHLGWSVRYRRRLTDSVDAMDNCWYVPGFGVSDKDNFGGTFNIIVDI